MNQDDAVFPLGKEIMQGLKIYLEKKILPSHSHQTSFYNVAKIGMQQQISEAICISQIAL